jgi:hypothetical protein
MKRVLTGLLLVVIVGGCLFPLESVGSVKASTSFNGLINRDTTWTKANSPYQLTSNVAVATGVTLTIEPGVTVNFKDLYIRVNGTLICRGTSQDKITLNGGELQFSEVNKGWNEETGSGSIIEQSQINFIRIDYSSPKIVDSTIGEIQITGGAPIIENNIIGDGTAALSLERETTAKISNNSIGYVHGDSVYMDLYNGNPLLVNNIIAGGIQVSGYSSSPIIANNSISSSYPANGNALESIIIDGCSVILSGNHLSGGVFVLGDSQIIGGYSGSATISNNVFSGGGIRVAGTATIQNNLIQNVAGPAILLSDFAVIHNNTISNNQIGIESYLDVDDANPIITYNNIVDNSQNSIYLHSYLDYNMSYNWWGTTDSNIISQSIYDNKNDFNLGTVNYMPFLPEKNSQAMPDQTAPGLSVDTQPGPQSTPQSETSQPTPFSSTPATLAPTSSQTVGAQDQIQSALSVVEIALSVSLVAIAVLVVALVFVFRRGRVKAEK